MPNATAGQGADQTLGKILYVEDSALVGRFLVDALQIENIDVTLAPDATAAFAFLEKDAIRFDLVLCDYKLPGSNGLEVMAAIRERYPELALVLTTGFAEEAVERAAAAYDGLLEKPFEIAELVALVNRHRR
ncbi:MAG: response regulator [Gammaproteobacteria bacterium]